MPIIIKARRTCAVAWAEKKLKSRVQFCCSTNYFDMPTPPACRFYTNKFPEVDDVVMVKVRSIAEMGAYVTLSEYVFHHPPLLTFPSLSSAPPHLSITCRAARTLAGHTRRFKSVSHVLCTALVYRNNWGRENVHNVQLGWQKIGGTLPYPRLYLC